MQKQTFKKVGGLALGSSMLVLSMLPAASAFAAKYTPKHNNYISNVTTTAKGLTFTASSTYKTGLHVWYQFRVEKNGKWVIDKKFSKNNTLTLPANTKVTAVEAWALTQYQAQHKQWDFQVKGSVAAVPSYGAPAAVQLSAASSSLVADGAATDTITATVVDSNGMQVRNFNGTVTITDTLGLIAAAAASQPSDVTNTGGTYTVQFKNGVASFAVGDTNAANMTDDITATPLDTSITAGTTSVSTTAPVATSVGFVNAPKAINDTAGSTSSVQLAVLDQLGNPMPYGAYTASVTVSGPATLLGGVSTEYVGLGPTGSVTVDPSGQAGTVTLTASASGLSSGATSILLAAPGAASQLAATALQTTAYSANTAGTWSSTEIGTVQAEDANGLDVAAPSSTPTATVTLNGQTASDFTASVGTPTPSGSSTVTVTYTGAGSLPVGTYDVNVIDGSLTTTIPFTVTAGTAAGVLVTPSGTTDVLASNPTTSVTAQIVDQYGNPVADAGQNVTFTSTAADDTLNGGSGAANNVKSVTTNADGAASIGATVLASGGTIGASVDGFTGTSGALNLDGAYATSVKATVSYGTNASSYVAGSPSGLTISGEALDSSGNTVSGDTLSATITGPGSYDQTATLSGGNVPFGTATGDAAYPTAPGTYMATITDTSVPSHPSTTTSFVVTAGSLSGFALLDANGNDLSSASTANDTVAADSTANFTVAPADAVGNTLTADASYTVNLPTATGVYWEDASGNPVSSLTFTYGGGAQTVKMVNTNGTAVTVGAATGATVQGVLAVADVGTVLTIGGGSPALSGTGMAYTDSSTTAETYTVTVKDASGVLANQTVYLTFGTGANSAANGSLSAMQLVTNANGQVTFTWAPPASWVASDTNVINIAVGAGATSPTAGSLTISE